MTDARRAARRTEQLARERERRQAWDRYAAAVLGIGDGQEPVCNEPTAALWADDLLKERDIRFPPPQENDNAEA